MDELAKLEKRLDELDNRVRDMERQFDKFGAHFTSEVDNWTKLTSNITNQLEKISSIVHGNGTKGINDKVRDLWLDYEMRKKSSQGYLDWVFRFLIMSGMTYLVFKVTGWR